MADLLAKGVFPESDSGDEDFDTEDPGTEIGIIGSDRRLWRLLCTPIIHLLVGKSKRRFSIHRGLLRRHSLTIRDMLRREPPRENNEDIVLELPALDVTAFAVFAEWIYVGQEADSGDILIDTEGKDVNVPDGDNFIGKVNPKGRDKELRKEAMEVAKAKQKRESVTDGRASESRTLVGDEDEDPMEEDEDENGEEEGEEDEEGEEGEEEEGEEEEEDEDEEGEEEEGEEEEEGDDEDGEDADKMDWAAEPTVDLLRRHDNYDFELQFTCYLLANKLGAPEFRRHILDEIYHHGEYCDPSDLFTELIGYVYNNTVGDDDPLRKFCVSLKCVRMPIQETLADPDFQALMEEGGQLVIDVMEICRKLATEEKWHEQTAERYDRVDKKNLTLYEHPDTKYTASEANKAAAKAKSKSRLDAAQA